MSVLHDKKNDLKGILWDSDLEDLTESLEHWAQDPKAAEEKLLRERQDLRQRSEVRALFYRGGRFYCDTVSRMRRVMDATCGKIPVPHGFFTAKEDRRIAVTEVCRLLTLLEGQVQALREGIAFYGEVLAKLRDLLAALVRIEAQWVLLRSRGGDDPADVEATERLPLDSLQSEKMLVKGLMEEICDFCDGVSHFCQDTWSAFCPECSKAADLAHNGDGGQIGTLLQVLGAFRRAVDGLPPAPEAYAILNIEII